MQIGIVAKKIGLSNSILRAECIDPATSVNRTAPEDCFTNSGYLGNL
jgi:hypothetical protein